MCPSLPPQSLPLSPTALCWHARDALSQSFTRIFIIEHARSHCKSGCEQSCNAIIISLSLSSHHTILLATIPYPCVGSAGLGLQCEGISPIGADHAQVLDSECTVTADNISIRAWSLPGRCAVSGRAQHAWSGREAAAVNGTGGSITRVQQKCGSMAGEGDGLRHSMQEYC